MLALAGGVAGAVTLSQFPEFSQQYLQRLSGAVNELRIIATGFDMTARLAGKTRAEALEELGDSGFTGDLRQNIVEMMGRYERLDGDYEALRDASALGRMAQPWNHADPELLDQTWQAYRPAVPVTWDGAICAGVGFVAGWGLVTGLFALILMPFRRRKRV